MGSDPPEPEPVKIEPKKKKEPDISDEEIARQRKQLDKSSTGASDLRISRDPSIRTNKTGLKL